MAWIVGKSWYKSDGTTEATPLYEITHVTKIYAEVPASQNITISGTASDSHDNALAVATSVFDPAYTTAGAVTELINVTAPASQVVVDISWPHGQPIVNLTLVPSNATVKTIIFHK